MEKIGGTPPCVRLEWVTSGSAGMELALGTRGPGIKYIWTKTLTSCTITHLRKLDTCTSESYLHQYLSREKEGSQCQNLQGNPVLYLASGLR